MIRREYFPRGDAVRGPAEWPIAPGAAFFAVRSGGRQVGVASLQIDTLVEGIKLDERTTLDLPASATGAPRRIALRIESLFSRNLRLRSWRTSLVEDGTRSQVIGAVDGDSGLRFITESAAGRETLFVRAVPALILPGAVPFRLRYTGGLRRNRTYEVPVLDPLTLRVRTVQGRVDAESLFTISDSAVYDVAQSRWVAAHADTVRAWRLVGDEYGHPVERWIDAQGIPVRTSTPLGLTIERSPFEIVSTNYRSRGSARAGSGFETGIVPAGLPPLARPRVRGTRESLVVRLGVTDPGDPTLDLRMLAGGTQIAAGDTVQVVAGKRVSTAPSFGSGLADTAERARGLSAEPLIQADHPRIQVAASRVVGTEREPRIMVERLALWVRREIREVDGTGVMSALRTLETRQGTAGDRERLFLALARAAGIPAREVAGLVMVDGRFYYHGWCEVLLDGWTPVDLVFATFPADAGHLRLTVGTSGREVDLLPYLGQLRLDLLNPEGTT